MDLNFIYMLKIKGKGIKSFESALNKYLQPSIGHIVLEAVTKPTVGQ